MKSFADFMKGVPDKYVPQIEDAISHACRVLGDPNASTQAYEAVQQRLTDIQLRVGLDSATALRKEIQERLLKRVNTASDMGLIEREVLSSRLNDFFKLAQTTRRTIGPSFGDTARNLFHWKEIKAMPAAQVILFGAFAVAAVVVGGSINQGRVIVDQTRGIQNNLELALRYQANVRTFIGDLRTSLPQAPSLPSAIAAVSNTPVAAEIREADGETHVVNTTIGGVYQALPPDQQEQMRSDIGSAESSGTGIHGTIHITPPFEGSPSVNMHF